MIGKSRLRLNFPVIFLNAKKQSEIKDEGDTCRVGLFFFKDENALGK